MSVGHGVVAKDGERNRQVRVDFELWLISQGNHHCWTVAAERNPDQHQQKVRHPLVKQPFLWEWRKRQTESRDTSHCIGTGALQKAVCH